MRLTLRFVLPAAAALVIAGSAAAQGPGGFQPSPEMQAKMRAWQKWRDNNKNIGAVQQTLFGLAELEKDSKTKLTKDQARKILAVIKPWRNKPVMTDEQARQVNKQVTAPLTVAQLQKLATAPQIGRGGRGFGGGARMGGPGGGPGGPGGGPGARPGGQNGRPGGPGGRPGGRGGFDISRFPDPKPYNPLNPASSPFAKVNPEASQRMTQRFNQMLGQLEARAK